MCAKDVNAVLHAHNSCLQIQLIVCNYVNYGRNTLKFNSGHTN